MLTRTLLVGTVCTLALVGTAYANDFHGLLGADYGQLHISSATADSYDIAGAAEGDVGFASLQLNAGYDRLDVSGGSLDHYSVAGSAFKRWSDWRAGVTVGYGDSQASGTSFNATNYGAFAEWFASPHFTVGAKGGGFSATASVDGYYLGGGATGYVTPNVAVNAAIDWTHISSGGLSVDETDYTIAGEYLVSQTTPISVYAGYTYSDLPSGAPHADTWFVGVRIYTDSNGPTTLVDRQRSGAVGWAASFSPLLAKF